MQLGREGDHGVVEGEGGGFERREYLHRTKAGKK